ncbi:MAG: histidine phosphatase family protein, partial [Eubacterium sp.]|nr:histidine phosphatase family protein [Eubacterium sp.]
MKIVICRHGDPYYEKDTLTEKGWREAELLAERISKLDVKDFYVSPLGRAKD